MTLLRPLEVRRDKDMWWRVCQIGRDGRRYNWPQLYVTKQGALAKLRALNSQNVAR